MLPAMPLRLLFLVLALTTAGCCGDVCRQCCDVPDPCDPCPSPCAPPLTPPSYAEISPQVGTGTTTPAPSAPDTTPR
jgi:hypothetical protein